MTETWQACRERRGERAGYLRHRRAREEPCQPCRDADRRYKAAYRASWTPYQRQRATTRTRARMRRLRAARAQQGGAR